MAKTDLRPASFFALFRWFGRFKARRIDDLPEPASPSIVPGLAPAPEPPAPQPRTPDPPTLEWTAPQEPSPISAEVVDSLTSEGVLVRDYDAAELYPGAVKRTVPALSILFQGGPPEVVLTVFEARRVALATAFYLPIDLENGRLFSNQTYEHVFVFRSGEPHIKDGTYSYNAGPQRVISQKAVVFGGPVDQNYYHWILNWLSRLAILKMLRPDIYDDPNVGIILDMRAGRSPFIDFLLASGIDPSRFIWTRESENMLIENAVLVSFGNRDETVPEVVSAMRDLFGYMGSPPPGGRRRLWISRQALGPDHRRVANMEDVSPILAAHGFEEVVLEGMPVADQIGLFQMAEAVVGVHGAGLTNMIFSPRDCRVMSIESDFNLKFGIHKFYSTLAEACGHPYEHMKVGRALRPKGVARNFGSTHVRDYILKPEVFDVRLAQFVSSLSSGASPS